jgi:hypothetical protein
MVLGMAPHIVFELATFGQLLHRIGARGIEQPILHDRAPYVR